MRKLENSLEPSKKYPIPLGERLLDGFMVTVSLLQIFLEKSTTSTKKLKIRGVILKLEVL